MRVFIAVVVILAIVGSIIFGVASAFHRDSLTNCQVIDKDRTNSYNSNKSSMRIYTKNCGTLEVSDTIIGRVNFNSADLYASIEVDHTYNFTTRGYRVGVISSFPVILTATEV